MNRTGDNSSISFQASGAPSCVRPSPSGVMLSMGRSSRGPQSGRVTRMDAQRPSWCPAAPLLQDCDLILNRSQQAQGDTWRRVSLCNESPMRWRRRVVSLRDAGRNGSSPSGSLLTGRSRESPQVPAPGRL
jgi:hypothetical protein